ncbi:integral membrane protein [Actinomadura sp. NBRC 104412]|uniref:hypothetical protein n=1 Tax=Actinomadura sp. NBRC 104412 TaxID=3032203 RepID=UPI0024A2BC6F|nr:hypothetical protein [Actinomadura sp. NBRC 104412]GLZ08597.1 integral membrane protein [Actinomadura sp. NBRC 104412]
MSEYFTLHIDDSGRLPLLAFFVAFIVTFVLTRVNVRLIRADVRWWFRNVKAGDLHIHHVVFGVVLMLVGGVMSVAIPDAYRGFAVSAAAIFGVGSALVLDEFALILHLSDVYWTEKGRASVDAVFVAIAVTGLLLLGVRPVGFAGWEPPPGSGLDGPVLVGIYAGYLVVNLVLAVLTLLKGKIWTGLAGLFVPVLLVIGAIRVARPGSPWARWRYAPGSRKHRSAVWHEERFRRPLIRAKIWVQEFIAGRHDLIRPEFRHRHTPFDRGRHHRRTEPPSRKPTRHN